MIRSQRDYFENFLNRKSTTWVGMKEYSIFPSCSSKGYNDTNSGHDILKNKEKKSKNVSLTVATTKTNGRMKPVKF